MHTRERETQLSLELRERGAIPPWLYLLLHPDLQNYEHRLRIRTPGESDDYAKYCGVMLTDSNVWVPGQRWDLPRRRAGRYLNNGINVVYAYCLQPADDKSSFVRISGLLREQGDIEALTEAIAERRFYVPNFPLSDMPVCFATEEPGYKYTQQGLLICGDKVGPASLMDLRIRPVEQAAANPARCVNLALQLPPSVDDGVRNLLFITGLRTISAVIQAQTKRAYDRAELQGNYNKALAIELDQLAALFDGLRSAADRLSDSLLFTSIAFRMRGIKSDTVDFPNKLRSPHIVDHIPGCDEIITVSYPEGDNAFPHDRPIIYLLGVRQADYYGQLTADLRPALLTKFFVARPQDAKLTEIAGNMARLAQVMTAQGVDLNRPAMVIFFPHKPYYGQAGYEAAAGLRLKEDLLTVINKLQEPA